MIVYLITNLINGKRYVGQHAGDDLERYWRRNVWLAEAGYQGKRALYRAIRKYEASSFKTEVLVVVGTKVEMDQYEIGLIELWDTTNPEKGYNITAGGRGSLGVKMSKETRAKMSKAREGKTMSEDNRRVLLERNKGNKYALGRKMTQDNFDKLMSVHIGTKRTDETKERMRQAQLGKTQSAETISKRVKTLIGQKRSEETKQRMSAALMGNGTGSHVRWHLRRNVSSPKCKLCSISVKGIQ